MKSYFQHRTFWHSQRWLSVLGLLALCFIPLISADGEIKEFGEERLLTTSIITSPSTSPITSVQALALKQQTLLVFVVAGIISGLGIVISLLYDHRKTDNIKRILFTAIALPIAIATLFATGTTLYLNIISFTQGPVHWHADVEIWNCDEQLNLEDPQGLSNRVGNPLLHEHDDQRIHVEGVVLLPQDVNLMHFFEVSGGFMENGYLAIPTVSGLVVMEDGELCHQQPGTVQLFAYTTDETGSIHQQKIKHPPTYLLSPHSLVPPGDCLIIEFAPEKNQTDKLCSSYEAALQDR